MAAPVVSAQAEIARLKEEARTGGTGPLVNKNQIPFDPRPPEAPSGLRLSSNAGTTRGFAIPEFQAVGHWIDRILRDPTNTQVVADVRQEVLELCNRYPIY
jgi:glycine hydroxymethyltransferase